MEIKVHPTFYRRWKIFFFGFALYFLVMLCTIIYLGNHGWDGFVRTFLLPFGFISIMALFCFGVVMAYRVPCPQCGAVHRSRAGRKELPDQWSSYCERCDVLWNLELGSTNT